MFNPTIASGITREWITEGVITQENQFQLSLLVQDETALNELACVIALWVDHLNPTVIFYTEDVTSLGKLVGLQLKFPEEKGVLLDALVEGTIFAGERAIVLVGEADRGLVHLVDRVWRTEIRRTEINVVALCKTDQTPGVEASNFCAIADLTKDLATA